MRKQTSKKWNGWKGAFFLLLLANVVLISVVYFSLFPKGRGLSENELRTNQQEFPSSFKAQVTLGATDLQTLLQQSLLELTEGTAPKIEVGNKINVSATLEMLGLPIPYNVEGEPFLNKDGNLQLKVEKIKLGNLSLPVQQSLQIMKSQIDPMIPMEMDSEKEIVTFLLSDIQTDTVQKITLLDINKELKEYTFEITLPKESLLQ